MSLSDVGLRKKFRDMFRSEKTFEVADLDRQAAKCDELFDLVHECVAMHGWNDNQC